VKQPNGITVRLDAKLAAAVRRWARTEGRSLKAQLDRVVRAALDKAQS
jgi:hypothetical protein